MACICEKTLLEEILHKTRDACQEIQSKWNPLLHMHRLSPSFNTRNASSDVNGLFFSVLMYILNYARMIFSITFTFCVYLFGTLVMPIRSLEYIWLKWCDAIRQNETDLCCCSNLNDQNHVQKVWFWFTLDTIIAVCFNLLVLNFIYMPIINFVNYELRLYLMFF